MIFVKDKYKEYKYLIKASDNYVILTNQNRAGGNNEYETIDVIYQYIIPSELVIEGEKQVWSETQYQKIETSQNYWDRADVCEIHITAMSITLLALFIINIVTKLVCKGGLVFGRR